MKIFDDVTVSLRRTTLAQNLATTLSDHDVALFYCGEPVQKPGGLDQTYPFLPHPEYFWLTGLRRASGVVAFSKTLGFKDFVKLPTAEEKLWEGTGDDISGNDLSELGPWLTKCGFKQVWLFGQPTQAQIETLKNVSLTRNAVLQTQLQELINKSRRPKDQAEIAMIKSVAAQAAAGYAKIASIMRPGLTEREIQIEYEAEVLRAGSEKFPYDTIVGSGTNAAILHAIPTARKIREDELVLVDAGADRHDYCVDITRTFHSSGLSHGRMSSQQQVIYNLVLQAQTEAIAQCRPGVEWREVHTTAARVIAQGLKDLGIFTCTAQTALETGAIANFLPHGVGHMVGLKVRDVGGIAGQPMQLCCGVRLRVDLPLEENFIMTVEPGIYFVKALVDNATTRSKFKSEINWNEVDKWLDFGGIRLEDDILITQEKPDNLTIGVPK